MLAGRIDRGKMEVSLGEAGYKVIAVMFFGKKEVARFLIRQTPQARVPGDASQRHARDRACADLRSLP
jgi:hypothetical protein